MDKNYEQLNNRIKELEKFNDSLKGINNFPKEVTDALISIGFLKYDSTLSYEGGVGGNYFENLIIKFNKTKKMISTEQIPMPFVIVSLAGNTCSLVNGDASYLADQIGTSIQFFVGSLADGTPGTIAGGLDNPIGNYSILSVTGDTFIFTDDGVNPVDITSIGAGTQYFKFW